MGDVFLEQIVKKQLMMKDVVRKSLWIAAGVLVFAVSFLFVFSSAIGPFAFLIGAGGLYYAWYFSTGLNLEFEYIFTNGEMDVDKISAKRKRKRMTTIRISSLEAFGSFQAETFNPREYDTVYDASISLQTPEAHYATFRDKEGKRCILVFHPNQKLQDAIASYYKRKSYAR